ncbi:MAG: hypothetical protein R3A52_03645 [Polyangiales bacterium]
MADTYDAMTGDRSYPAARSTTSPSPNEIERCAGTQFDPDCAHPFLEVVETDREERQARGETVPE